MASDEVKKVSLAVIRRLPKYHKCLGELLQKNVERVSSQELGRILGFTASQVRQDLNNFGEFGQQGYGYNVEQLYNEIAKILGLNTEHKMVIVGAGKLGQALAGYGDFERHGFKILALFDVNPNLIGSSIRGVPVHDMKDIIYFINENEVDIAVITVPRENAQEVADTLSQTLIKGIWNFAPVEVKAGPGVIVENVHLLDGLLTLSYRMNESRLTQKLKKIHEE
ncbi:redox-sensing transcriptional repressor Rex [Thermosediminibacter litoriperuensis]|uniref:Redox-sensing transcriptional repressor Rex n=1 Tax=Thermosediminibacter litoriperuensis TaxID=291989 RepID=A0A5S5AL81_9FIRM|nr:redox-sensing transcriptional repressor Rex [Thermosediminibacter litoriperuensis]TYP51604.1 redox-sensing transcriptional repressor [Thermosediminibacter litoriperuensis]